MSTNKDIARIAGFLYLIVAVAAGFAQVFRTNVIVPGNAIATVANITSSEWLFRLSFVSDIFAQVCQVLLVLAIYVLLKPINKTQAQLMVMFVAVFVPMVCLNMLNQFAALILLGGDTYVTAFSPDQLHGLAMLFLDLHKYGLSIIGVFFGLWLFPFGYLVFKSGYIPKAIGVLLMVGCFGYLVQFVTIFLFPGNEVITYPGIAVVTIAELSIAFWLLIKGAKVPELKSANLNPATIG